MKVEYGSVPALKLQHGYGPGAKNAYEALMKFIRKTATTCRALDAALLDRTEVEVTRLDDPSLGIDNLYRLLKLLNSVRQLWDAEELHFERVMDLLVFSLLPSRPLPDHAERWADVHPDGCERRLDLGVRPLNVDIENVGHGPALYMN